MDRSGKRRKRKKRGDERAAAGAPSPSSASFDRHFFPVLLAAARTTRQSSSSCSPAALAARLLRRVLSHSPQTLSPLPASLVALLPLLLSSSCSSVAALSCEVLGVAALRSIDAGETLASDSGIASGLARTLGSRSQRVIEAACNSILDLSASSVGRERLAGSPVLPRTLSPITGNWLYKGEEKGDLAEKLLYLKLPTTNYIVESVYGFAHSRSTECLESPTETNKIMCLIIDTVVLLVNSCKIGNLQNIQQELARNVMSVLYKIWKKTQALRSSTDCNIWKNKVQSREYDISKAIFSLSIGLASPAWPEPDVVKKDIFGETVSDFETFVLAYWEKLPNLYRRKQDTQIDSPVFIALHGAFNLGTAPGPIIESLLHGIVSCPAIASDELDINSFLHEVYDSLGDSVKYRQDIRVMRTQDPNGQTLSVCVTEEHFFDDGTVFTNEDAFIEKCKHAFKNGYSIALRGMEFRSEKVAAIASALADLFGQPSVGANLYFSPARSQGLARHYDDHCVLVWQLLGSKKWVVWPNPKPLLPRLYEPFDPLDGTLDESSGRVEVLHEGDMMYIPRGYVHEARTDVGGSEANAYADCSLHLTLAIEVEPPFEWEGFAHIALHCWAEQQQLRDSQSVEFEGKAEASLSAVVLHVAIRLLSDSDPIFRKACMVAAKAATLPSSGSCTATAATHLEALRSSQRSTFDEILRNIDQDCSIKEALKRIALAVKERDDGAFQWMSWLRHLPQQGTAAGYSIDFCNILGTLEEIVEAFDSDPGQALDGFAAFKSEFCQRVVYEDACEAFGTLLEMYRVARTQYMRGMLALHGAGAHVS